MATIVGLDVGEKRIGVAKGDDLLRIAYPLTTVAVDGSELKQLTALVRDEQATRLVVGFPRNQSGEVTEQTKIVEAFARGLDVLELPIAFQDESLTSVVAEQRLREAGKPYTKEMIDAEAAAVILQDYLEENYGH